MFVPTPTPTPHPHGCLHSLPLFFSFSTFVYCKLELGSERPPFRTPSWLSFTLQWPPLLLGRDVRRFIPIPSHFTKGTMEDSIIPGFPSADDQDTWEGHPKPQFPGPVTSGIPICLHECVSGPHRSCGLSTCWLI